MKKEKPLKKEELAETKDVPTKETKDENPMPKPPPIK